MGTNFCTSAINAMLLVLKNSATFILSEGLGSIFVFLGKITISVLNMLALYAIILAWPSIINKIHSPFGPLLIVFAISYLISSVFMSIYSVTSTSMLQCFLVDVELSKKEGKEDPEIDGQHRPKEMESLVRTLRRK